MVKSKLKTRKGTNKVTTRVAKTQSSLDSAATSYARLLADPCNAPLVHPVYSGAEGGYLVRVDNFYTLGVSAGSTSGILVWTPGAIGTTNSELVGFETNNPAVAGSVSAIATAPGKTFLQAASNVRCVAACMKASYPGSESTRSGRVHFGQLSGSAVDVGDTPAVDNVSLLLPYYSRTPADIVEVIWKPNDADQLFTDPNAVTLASEKDRKAAIGFAWAGLPATTGMTFHMTAVYEWQPAVGRGLAVPNLSKSPSNNSLDHVVNYLINKGFNFVHGISLSIGAGVTQGLIGTLGNGYGLMPSSTRQRSSYSLMA